MPINNHTVHKNKIRVYYEDTDSGGVVYYANYLKFAERSRTELLRELGIDQFKLSNESCIYFVVKSAEIDFVKSAKLDDLLTVETSIYKISKASIIMNQQIFNDNDLLSKIKVKIACVNSDMKVCKIPKHIIELLQNFQHSKSLL